MLIQLVILTGARKDLGHLQVVWHLSSRLGLKLIVRQVLRAREQHVIGHMHTKQRVLGGHSRCWGGPIGSIQVGPAGSADGLGKLLWGGVDGWVAQRGGLGSSLWEAAE